VQLHLDGSGHLLPAAGTDLLDRSGRRVGHITTSARHHELGPVALGLVKRSTPVAEVLVAEGVTGSQEVVVAP
jgi:hypothetical protein